MTETQLDCKEWVKIMDEFTSNRHTHNYDLNDYVTYIRRKILRHEKNCNICQLKSSTNKLKIQKLKSGNIILSELIMYCRIQDENQIYLLYEVTHSRLDEDSLEYKTKIKQLDDKFYDHYRDCKECLAIYLKI